MHLDGEASGERSFRIPEMHLDRQASNKSTFKHTENNHLNQGASSESAFCIPYVMQMHLD